MRLCLRYQVFDMVLIALRSQFDISELMYTLWKYQEETKLLENLNRS